MEITTDIVVNSFTWCTNHYGPPQSTLTDNGLVYTTRLLKRLNKFEKLLIPLGIRQKNGSPYHPLTQVKVERFHHTEHLWVNARPRLKQSASCRRSWTSSSTSTTPSGRTGL